MINVLYVVGNGSSWRDNELRFSLRSLEKFIPDHGTVYVVGHLPSGLKGIVHIPAEDEAKNPIVNVNSKLLLATEKLSHLDEFLLFNDDFWLTGEWQSDTYYYDGTLEGRYSKFAVSADNYYLKAIKETLADVHVQSGGVAKNFELHCPILFNVRLLKDVLDAGDGIGAKLVRTLYCSTVTGLKIQEMPDCKLRRDWRTPDSSIACVSADDFAIRSQWAKKWFLKMYPEPSRYETEELVM